MSRAKDLTATKIPTTEHNRVKKLAKEFNMNIGDTYRHALTFGITGARDEFRKRQGRLEGSGKA